MAGGNEDRVARDVPVAPANIGPRSTPDYDQLAKDAIQALPGGGAVFAGPRADGFYVDLGSVFDLLDAAPVPEPAPVRLAGAALGEHLGRAERAHHRAAAADLALTRDGSTPKDVEDPRR